MNLQKIESEGFDVIRNAEGVTVKARHWVEDWGPFPTDAEAVVAVLASVPALAEPD